MASNLQVALCAVVLVLALSSAQANGKKSVGSVVPKNKRFTFVNTGDLVTSEFKFGVEYGGKYRVAAPLTTYYFSLAFLSTDKPYNKFEVSTLMADINTKRVVWTANRNHLVREKSTLAFGADGNLVLKEADGTLVWETGTANKGVVDIKMKMDGNLVLLDKNNNTVWQSFDHPTDTLLVGQSLNLHGVKRLVSRKSEANPQEGSYSLEMEAGGIALYDRSSGEPLPYWVTNFFTGEKEANNIGFVKQGCKNPVGLVTLKGGDTQSVISKLYTLDLDMVLSNSTLNKMPKANKSPFCDDHGNVFTGDRTSTIHLGDPVEPTEYSFIRVEADGNLRGYTYRQDFMDLAHWTVTYQQFGCLEKGSISVETHCNMPGKCGRLGLCSDNMCVGCPLAKSVAGWTPGCSPAPLPACGKYSESKIGFYSIAGAEHHSLRLRSNEVGVKKVALNTCKKACAKDCKCAAFFYWKESSTCFLTPNVGTLNQAGNSSHIAFIKYPTS